MQMAVATSGVAASMDGTPIGWTQQGSGPAIVIVNCVMASRARTPQPALPSALGEHYTVFTYDRRGTGESDTTTAYAVEREFEDLDLVLQLAGPGAAVYGFSSGATLALLAAAHGAAISHLLLLEPPLISDSGLGPLHEASRRLARDRADARRWFDEEVTGIPAEIRATFPPLTEPDLANAPAMLHELTFLPGTTAAQFASLLQPALLMASDHTAPFLKQCVQELEAAMPNAVARFLPGHWHGIDDAKTVLAICEFLAGNADWPTIAKDS
jgi:pimeloyl-ACP methyl ester carboxylesterase